MHLNRKEKTLILTIAINIGLILLKFGLFWFSGSLALKAGAWHSFSDIFVSSIVFLGLILSRKENLQHSHGISRIENILAIIIGFFIIGVGVDIFVDVIQGDQMSLYNVPAVIAGSTLTIIISYFMARYKIYVGRETNSPALTADGFHSKLDMYSSMVVVVGLIGYQIGLKTMDRVAAIVVVVLVVLAGVKIIFGSTIALRTGGLPEMLSGKYLKLRSNRWASYFRKLIIPFLIVIYLVSGIYVVRWDQVGIEKRFGKPIKKQVQPGIHYRLPWPLSTVDLINTENVRVSETQKSLMLTGDENLIEVEATSHFTVKNAFNFIYSISEPKKVVALTVESVVREIISRLPVDEILTEGKDFIQKEALNSAQVVLDKSKAGITLVTIQLIRAAPPDDVIAAFQDVASAKEDQVTYLNEAYAYQNEVLPISRGKAFEVIADAEAYREEKITGSRGEAKSFLKRLDKFDDSRDITQTRMYIETMERVLTGNEKLIIDNRINTNTTDIWLFNGDFNDALFQEGVKK